MQQPSPEITQRTFRAELVRSFSGGVAETALQTFAVLVAVTHFAAGPGAKALIVCSQAIGLIVSLFVVPLAARFRWRVTGAAAGINALGAVGFVAAACFQESVGGFVAGCCVGLFSMALPIPLQTHYLRHNYPDGRRGRLFSLGNVLRAVGSMAFSFAGGWMLEVEFGWYPVVFLILAGACLTSSLSVLSIPSPSLPEVRATAIFSAFGWVGRDAAFRRVLISAMAMGIGMLTMMPLRVEYLANPHYGLAYTAATVSLLTGVLPSFLRVLTTFFWGLLFDRLHLYRLRLLLNVIFAVSIAFFFLTREYWIIFTGAALFGIARGGAEVVWNLWVTKLARPEHSAEYMAVHTCLTGVRGVAAPFAGFYVASHLSMAWAAILSISLILLSFIPLLPLLKEPAPEGTGPPGARSKEKKTATL